MWIVEGELSGERKEFKTKKDALEFLKDVKRFDKENGIEDRWTVYKEK